MPAETFPRVDLPFSRVEGGQLRDGKFGPGCAGDSREPSVEAGGVRDQSGSVRDQVHGAGIGQPGRERERATEGIGHDPGDRWTVEHRRSGRGVRSNVRADGELHTGGVRDHVHRRA